MIIVIKNYPQEGTFRPSFKSVMLKSMFQLKISVIADSTEISIYFIDKSIFERCNNTFWSKSLANVTNFYFFTIFNFISKSYLLKNFCTDWCRDNSH